MIEEKRVDHRISQNINCRLLVSLIDMPCRISAFAINSVKSIKVDIRCKFAFKKLKKENNNDRIVFLSDLEER